MDTASPINSDMLVRYSDAFNDEAAEITYQSCDHVRFRIHAIYLKAHCGILAPPEGTLLNEIVYLPESATVLEILFKFIYPVIQPVLALEVDFTVLKDLAEAAEKYQIFPAMYACYSEMQTTLPSHAIFVLGYALKHGYVDLADDAAPYTIDDTFPDVVAGIPTEFRQFWLKYHKQWKDLRRRALHYPCSDGKKTLSTISLPACELSSFRDYKKTFAGKDVDWVSAVKEDVEALPKICDIIGLHEIKEGLEEVSTGVGAIVMESYDGVQHYVDPDILHACSRGFNTPEGNRIMVPESSATIGLLLRYLRPARLPPLTLLSFEGLRELALAAEKYCIHPAMGSCRIMMRKHLPANAKEVFQYALNARYFDVLDVAARFILGQSDPFFEFAQDLPTMLLIPWARYYQSWRDLSTTVMKKVQQIAESSYSSTYNSVDMCSCWTQSFGELHVLSVLDVLMEGPESLRNLDLLFPTEKTTCREARDFYTRCREMVEKLLDEIPPLSSLL